MWLHLTHVISKLHSLSSFQSSKYHIFLTVRIGSLRLADGRTALQLMCDKIADWLRIIADYIKILTQIDIFNHIVYDQSFSQQSAE